MLREKKIPKRIIQLVKLTFYNEGEKKTFPDKQKLREMSTLDLPYYELLMEVLQVEIK